MTKGLDQEQPVAAQNSMEKSDMDIFRDATPFDKLDFPNRGDANWPALSGRRNIRIGAVAGYVTNREEEDMDGAHCLLHSFACVHETQNAAIRNVSASTPIELPRYEHLVGVKSTAKAHVVQSLSPDVLERAVMDVVPVMGRFREMVQSTTLLEGTVAAGHQGRYLEDQHHDGARTEV